MLSNTMMVLVLFWWCFTDGISSGFITSLEDESTPKGMEYRFDIRDSKSFEEIISDSSQYDDNEQPIKPPSSHTHTHTHTHNGFRKSGNRKPLKPVELDSDLETLSSYEDSIYNKKDYPRDEPYSIHSNPSLLKDSKEHSIPIEEPNGSDTPITTLTMLGTNSGSVSESEIFTHAKSPSERVNADGKKLAGESISSGESSGGGDMKSGSLPEEKEEVEIGDQQEKLLLQKLMRGYERDVRPVKNASHPVEVRVGITLTQIFDMDEKQQVLTTNVWLDQEWNDEMLRWDPKDFGGLEVIRLPCARIWLPDIVLYNNADDYTRGYMPSRAMVSFDGNVFWPPPTKFRSTCSVDVTYFPFDDQTCKLKLGSWTYNGFQVNVTNRTTAVDLSNYISNGEWQLIRAIQQRNVVYYPCCPEPFPDVTITLVIRRKTLYYIYNIVLPCIMLSALTLLVFCLPPDSGEKIALGITVLLAFSVFMLAINESLPETSESIPLIGVYLTIVMAITSVSVIMTVVVLNLHYLGPQVRPVPAWLMCLLPKGDGKSRIRQKSLLIPSTHREPRSGSLKRGHILITQWRRGAGEGYSIEVPEEKLEGTTKEPTDVSVESITNDNSGNCSNTRRRLAPQSEGSSTYFPRHLQQPQRQTQSGLPKDSAENGEGSWNVFEELLTSIRHLINKQEEVEHQNNLVAEWRLVAQVVDRILFWLFFIFTLSSSALILLVLPIYKRSWFGSPLLIINDTDIDIIGGT